MASSSQHRCVFVGNIPYDATEEQLIDIWREVGPVVFFRLVIDSETGKPKGYAFCEYKDEETALSARCNLQGYEINGRQLWADFAENDKNADRNRERGCGGPGLVANSEKNRGASNPWRIFSASANRSPCCNNCGSSYGRCFRWPLGSHPVKSNWITGAIIISK